jgi:O-antigen/teichoic acid export membrane protein
MHIKNTPKYLFPAKREDNLALVNFSHRIIQKLAFLMSAHWIREALQTVFLIYLARKSSKTYGEFMLAMSVGQIILFISEFGINQHLVTLLAQDENDSAEVLAQVSVLKSGLFICAFMGGWGFMTWQGYSSPLQQLVLIIALGLGLEALSSSFFVACQVQGRQGAESKVRTLAASLGFGYGLATLFIGATPFLVAFYKLIETLINLTGAISLTLKQIRSKLRWPRFSRILAVGRESMVFTLMAMAAIGYNKANIFFLQRYAGADGVAQYSVTWQLVDGISCLVSNLLLKNILFSIFVKLWATDGNEFHRMAKNAARWLLLVSLPFLFILNIESDRIITWIYGTGYSQAIWMQKWLALTVAFAFVHNLAAYLMVAMKKEWLLLAFYIGGLALNIACCALMIPAAPLQGTVLAIVLTKGVVAVLTVSYCQLKLALFSGRTFLSLGAAALSGGFLYVIGTRYVFREVAEIAALIPILALAWWWAKFADSAKEP